MSFKYHMGNKFSSCRLLAETYDEHRKRDVRVYLMPGEFSVVGVTDGVDAWIAPTIINPFSCNVQDILRRIQSGEDVPVVRRLPQGHIPSPQSQGPPTRRRLGTAQEAPVPTRRRLLAADEPQQPTRRRLHAST